MRIVHCVALAAALITLAICVWFDATVATSLGRVVVAYLTTFGVGVLGVIGLRAAALQHDGTAPPGGPVDAQPSGGTAAPGEHE